MWSGCPFHGGIMSGEKNRASVEYITIPSDSLHESLFIEEMWLYFDLWYYPYNAPPPIN